MRKNKCLKDTSIESVFIVTYHYLDDACSELLLLVATSSSRARRVYTTTSLSVKRHRFAR